MMRGKAVNINGYRLPSWKSHEVLKLKSPEKNELKKIVFSLRNAIIFESDTCHNDVRFFIM